MSLETIAMGPNAELWIEDQVFVWTGGNITLNQKEHEVNDSSQPDWDQFRGGRRRMMFNGTFQEHTDRNIHAAPYLLGDQEFVPIKVFPKGSDGHNPYECSIIATAIKIDMPVKAGDAVSGSIDGGSVGEVTLGD